MRLRGTCACVFSAVYISTTNNHNFDANSDLVEWLDDFVGYLNTARMPDTWDIHIYAGNDTDWLDLWADWKNWMTINHSAESTLRATIMTEFGSLSGTVQDQHDILLAFVNRMQNDAYLKGGAFFGLGVDYYGKQWPPNCDPSGCGYNESCVGPDCHNYSYSEVMNWLYNNSGTCGGKKCYDMQPTVTDVGCHYIDVTAGLEQCAWAHPGCEPEERSGGRYRVRPLVTGDELRRRIEAGDIPPRFIPEDVSGDDEIDEMLSRGCCG